MPAPHERTPRERETLIFPDAKAADVFRERVGEQLQQPITSAEGREIVRQELSNQFASHGEAVATVKQPWEHTPAEHEEAQQLADAAFAEDLGAALKQARQSSHYPRNLDLLHDLLTGELYEYVRSSEVNQQPMLIWILEIAVIILVAALGVLVVLMSA